MTQKEHVRIAIGNLELAIDTFPDKDDMIRNDNSILYGIIAQLRLMIDEVV